METTTNKSDATESKPEILNEWDTTDFRWAQTYLDKTISWMKLDEDILTPLRYPKRAMQVIVPVRMDDGSVRSFVGYRVHHDLAMGPAVGGVRFNKTVSMGQVAAMAMLMTWKCALMNLPFGGGHGGMRLDPKELSIGELERATRRYAAEIIDLIGPSKDVQTPDLNSDERTMAWILDTYSVNAGYTIPSIVTGKPKSIGGSLSSTQAIGYGVAMVTRRVLKRNADRIKSANPTVAIQGFGKVGSNVAESLTKHGFSIVAVSDSQGGIYNKNGLNIKDLITHKSEHGTFTGFKGGEAISNPDLLNLDCDILIPAAIRSQINKDNVQGVRAKMIVEGANAPITPKADEYLESKNIIVVPDILANGAGTVVGYLEWVQGLMRLFWAEEEVYERLDNFVDRVCDRVFNVVDEYGCSYRMAAMRLALDRVTEARWQRGLYP